MADYRLGFTAEETQDLERVGGRLLPLVRMAIDRPDGLSGVIPELLPGRIWRRRGWEWELGGPVHWAESEGARRLLTDPVERRRFQAWEREVLLTAGMPPTWSYVTARQSAEAWEVMGDYIPPLEFPRFVRKLGLATRPTTQLPLLLRQWWGWLRHEITEPGVDDGAPTLGGFASWACNVAVGSQPEESLASQIAAVVIAAPACARAIKGLPRLDSKGSEIDSSLRDARQRALDAWAACLSAAYANWMQAFRPI